ncbi:MAG TPA: helix-hairpin-helix domain-containing protein [Polyangiales bacterium]
MQGSPRLGAAGVIVSLLAIAALASTRPPAPQALQRSPPVARVAVSALRDGDCFDVNRASAADFRLLPGIGPKLAERIVAARERRGSFARAEDLQAVRGIGPLTFARIHGFVRVGPCPQRSRNSNPDSVSVK